MQFVNIVVHSVEDMNFRVHLQYEFTKLGFDDYLEKLRHTESEELQVQISAYLDNVFDVAALMEDSETKTAALEKVAELEDELGHVCTFSLNGNLISSYSFAVSVFHAEIILQAHDRLAASERECLCKLASLESELVQLRSERDELSSELQTLRRTAQQHQQDAHNRQSVLENKIQELETLTRTLPRPDSMFTFSFRLEEQMVEGWHGTDCYLILQAVAVELAWDPAIHSPLSHPHHHQLLTLLRRQPRRHHLHLHPARLRPPCPTPQAHLLHQRRPYRCLLPRE